MCRSSRLNAWRAGIAGAAAAALLAIAVWPLPHGPMPRPRPAIVGGQVVAGQVTFSVNFTELVSSGVILPFDIPEAIQGNLNYTNGTGPNQVDTIYAVALSLAGATQTISLQSLTDPSGTAINFARVRELIVVNTATTSGYDLKIEAGASSGVPWLPSSSTPVYARVGGSHRTSDPISTGSGNGNVIGSSTKNITFDPGANSFTAYLLIIGGSAAFPCLILIPRSLRRRAGRRAA